MQDREIGRDNCWAEVYLKVHTDPGTNKPHPTVEARTKTYKTKRLASMRASGIEIPMSQTNEGSSAASQPMYVGEDDILWMETVNHKKGHVLGFGNIQPCLSLSTRSSHYASTSRSHENMPNVDQLESMKSDIARLNEVNHGWEERFQEMQMDGHPTISTSASQNISSSPKHTFRTNSDCEVIAHLYEEHGEDFVNMLDGVFSFVLLDAHHNSFFAARDAIGVTPLYIGWGLDGSVWISSEMKGLNDDCEHFEIFPPGNLYSSKTGGFRRWYNPLWFSEMVPCANYDPLVLRKAFEEAVIKRLMTDVPFGVLLSGGLDSSLVAAVTSRHLEGTKAAKEWGSKLHSFCVGLEGSPDLKAAKEVAEYLGTVHHEFYFTVQDGIDAIEDVIHHVETYDVTTIRASTPMFLMSRKIKALGVKMVISGEGSDEIFGGYLYFHKAPNKEEFHVETCHKIKALHKFDCLRANKSTSAWGLEVRVPFLDKQLLDVAMNIDPEFKMINGDKGRIEKWALRKAFDDEERPYLPKHILYRQKEQFSDGVGYSWIDGLKAHASAHVTDKMMQNAGFIYPHNTPTSKEAYHYRVIFERLFPQNSARLTVPEGRSIACSTAKAVEWDANWSKNLDPSGRAALGVHASAYEPQLLADTVNGIPPQAKIKKPRIDDAVLPVHPTTVTVPN